MLPKPSVETRMAMKPAVAVMVLLVVLLLVVA